MAADLVALYAGHQQAGVSLLPGGLTIDVSGLKDVHIDPVTRTARFQVTYT